MFVKAQTEQKRKRAAMRSLENVNNCMLMEADAYLRSIYSCLGLDNKDIITLYLWEDGDIQPVAHYSVSLCEENFQGIYQEDRLFFQRLCASSDICEICELEHTQLSAWTRDLLGIPETVTVDPLYNVWIGRRVVDCYMHRQIGFVIVRSLRENTEIDTSCLEEAGRIFSVFLSVYSHHNKYSKGTRP